MIRDAVVIGAGWAGLKAATELTEAGHGVLVLEKSRGAGGRSATRRIDGARFDHGAQYFTARSAAFGRRLQQWRDAGLVQPWKPRLAIVGGRAGHGNPEDTLRFVGVPGMNAVCKQLAGPLECRYQQQVGGLRFDKVWKLSLDDGDSIEARRLVVTAPPAQSAELLGATDPLYERLSAVDFNPCIATLLAFESPFDPSFDAAFVNSGGPLSWIARDSSKPGRDGSAWMLHASAEWSRDHLSEPFDDLAEQMVAAFDDVVGEQLPSTRIRQAHRWRYAQVVDAFDDGALVDTERRLAVAGDWLAGSRIEGAWTSGRKAGQALAAT
jgi:predicted NAD/FAD-dependent oxidoreductase